MGWSSATGGHKICHSISTAGGWSSPVAAAASADPSRWPSRGPGPACRSARAGRRTLHGRTPEIAAHGRPTHSASCDLADRDAIFRYVGDAAAALGGIDVLV